MEYAIIPFASTDEQRQFSGSAWESDWMAISRRDARALRDLSV
jgi:hypothetical protein